MPDITTKDVIRIYKTGKTEVIALRGMNLTVRDGEMVTILGPSGCGKSTLLNMIGGLDRPNAGSITVGGKDIVKFTDAELVKYRRETVGVVFQFFNLVPTLTAEENIELPMQLLGRPAAERRKRTNELLRLVGLEARGPHRPEELSGGEQQRIAIAVALANDPPLILADEPTGELDTKTGHEVLALFHALQKKQGKTLVIVTHDERIAAEADRAIRMVDGKMAEPAPKEEKKPTTKQPDK
jgi:ABC-type lipoprotein export system ATPase subunit